jgi:8-oxo-dGTP diphosphatase
MPSSPLTRPQWPRPGASAAIFRDDQVLIVQRGKAGAMRGLWSLPGGHIEPGERAQDAAVREVREETRIKAAIAGLADVHDVLLTGSDGSLIAHYVLAVYYGRWLAGEPIAGSDCLDARFAALGTLDAYDMTPGARAIIMRARSLLDAGNANQ